jgi:hypothetical protein
MKTLKQLAIVALVCHGSAAMAMERIPYGILNKSSYEITVIPKKKYQGRLIASAPEKIAAGKAKSYDAEVFEIQSKYANGVITESGRVDERDMKGVLRTEGGLDWAQLDKNGKPSRIRGGGIKGGGISWFYRSPGDAPVLVIDVGLTTGFTVKAITDREARDQYPNSGLKTIVGATVRGEKTRNVGD